jgi:peptide/nickel transport system permease protein
MAAESLAVVPTRSKSDRPALLRLAQHPLAQLGTVLVILLLLMATVGRHFTPGPPDKIYPNGISKWSVPHAPGGGFLLGADSVGHDVWTRLVYGASRTLIVGLCTAVTAALLGSVIGLLGGYAGGRTDRFLTRFTEIVSSLPTILLAITLAIVIPDHLPAFPLFKAFKLNPDLSLPKLLLAISLVTWTRIARAVRGQTLSLKQREFIEAARAMGCSHFTILWRHLLPNVLPTVVALTTISVAGNILLEAGLSYLALGGDPSTPSWGGLISDGQPYLIIAPWIVLAPGIAIVVAVTAFNLLGTALQEVLETRR